MSRPKMHADEVDIDVDLARRLIAMQHQQWADLPIARVESSGTDNAMFRLGDEMSIRLPRVARATGQTEKERHWLPVLAPLLPVPIPVPLAHGVPGEGYPFPWSVCRWVQGENPRAESSADAVGLAVDLAHFVGVLHRIDVTGAPPSQDRGLPLVTRDARTRTAIDQLKGTIDTERVSAAWEADMNAPAWARAPVWLHGDLSGGNVLVLDGRLSGVIDFGFIAGDPGCELQPAWNLFSGASRGVFRDALDIDDATWARGRGWALSVALLYVPYYEPRFPELTVGVRRMIDDILDDHDR